MTEFCYNSNIFCKSDDSTFIVNHFNKLWQNMWSWNNYIIDSQPIVTSNGNAPLRPWSCIKAKIRSIVPSNGNAPSRPWRCIMAKFEIILVRLILTYCHYCVQGSHRRFLVMLQVLRSRVRLSSSRSDWFQSQIHICSRQMNSLSLQKY